MSRAKLTLFDRSVSGNCWRVRLMLSFLGLSSSRVEVDILAGENREPTFLAINPRGQVPALLVEPEDGSPFAIRDSVAILAWLAARHGPEWIAEDPIARAREQEWLAIAGQEHQTGIRAARAVLRFSLPPPPGVTLHSAQALARRALGMMGRHLEDTTWLTGERPTIADIACFPYAALAPEAGVEVEDGGPLDRWFGRFRALPGFIALDDNPPGERLAWRDWSVQAAM